jgi:hypothetical protein
MLKSVVPLAVILTALCGCALIVSSNAHLYPVAGPLSTQTPLPVFVLKLGPGLEIGVTLPSGEHLTGQRKYAVESIGLSGDPLALPAVWDEVFGSGYYVARVLGKQAWRAELSGDKGAALSVQYISDVHADGIVLNGVARDGIGNVFKIAY